MEYTDEGSCRQNNKGSLTLVLRERLPRWNANPLKALEGLMMAPRPVPRGTGAMGRNVEAPLGA